MSKEYIQAADNLFGLVAFQKSLTRDQFTRMQKYFDVIEKALQRLESIDNANPSNALELVYCLKDYLMNMTPYYDWLNDIEKYILKAQEQEKALNSRGE